MANDILESGNPKTISEIEDLLAEDNKDDELVDDKTEVDEEEEKPVKESDKEEDEEKEDEEEELELKDDDDTKFVDIPSRKVILKAYPKIFKEFPGIEHAMYRDRQYTEIFADPKDAETAKEELDELKEFQGKVNSGSLEEILTAVKENSVQGFDKIKSNYLTTLMKIDERAYYDTIAHVINNAIFAMYNNGKELNNEQGEQLQIAAQLMNQYINHTNQIRVPQRREAPKEDPEKEKLENERRQFLETKLNDAIEDVKGKVENSVRSTVDRNIDPNDTMTGYVRTKAINDVIDQLDEAIENDTRFRNVLDKLWKDSSEKNYSRESKEKIKSALFSRARTLLPDIIRRVRADALKGASKLPGNKKEVSVKKSNNADDERPERKSSREREPEKPNRKLSTFEHLMRD